MVAPHNYHLQKGRKDKKGGKYMVTGEYVFLFNYLKDIRLFKLKIL